MKKKEKILKEKKVYEGPSSEEIKKQYFKVGILSFFGMLLFLGGLITGAVLLYNSDIEKEKVETEEKNDKVYRFKATSNVLNFFDLTRNNNYKEGTYIVDYHSDFEDTKYEFSIEFNGKYGVNEYSIVMRFEDKVVEYKCDYSCGYETNLYVNSDFEYVIIAQMNSFLPIGMIDIYDFSGNLVKSFDNVVNAYYDCDDGLFHEKYIRVDVDYSESSYRGTTIYLVENFIEEDYEWNWFDAPVSVYKFNFETLETEKVSEFTACFSQQ